MKLQAKFVVAIQPQQFEFKDAAGAAAFQRALAKFSARSARKHANRTGLGPNPAVGSLLNAYPILEDGSVSEHGLTLGEQASEVNYVEKKRRTPKGRKAKESTGGPSED